MTSAVVLVDAGGNNLGSIRYALGRLGVDAEPSADAERIRAASHLILPGVGVARHGMQRLRESGLADLLRTLTQPLLGICLGMQLLFAHSAEADTTCLGLLDGDVRRLPRNDGVRVPHVGWNDLRIEHRDPLLDGIDSGGHAYFVHSYAATVDGATLASCDHGSRFSAIVRRGNVCGVQFHPERSGALGARLLANFLQL